MCTQILSWIAVSSATIESKMITGGIPPQALILRASPATFSRREKGSCGAPDIPSDHAIVIRPLGFGAE
jgi:hypothetical protein